MTSRFCFAFWMSVVSSLSAHAQLDKIERALRFPERTENLVYRDQVQPHWLADGKSFWYRIRTGRDQHEFVWVETETGMRRTAASLDGLGLPESQPLRTSQIEFDPQLRSSRTGISIDIVFVNETDDSVELHWIREDGQSTSYGKLAVGEQRAQHTFEGHVWSITDGTGTTLVMLKASATVDRLAIDGKGIARRSRERTGKRNSNSTSPDGRVSIRIEGDALHLTDDDGTVLRPNGEESSNGDPYRGDARWSPDSSALVLSSAPDYEPRRVALVESSPKDRLQPKLIEFDYIKPGDELPATTLSLFRVGQESFERQTIERALFPTPFATRPQVDVEWSPDSREFYFDYNQRGHQLYRVLAVDRETGHVRIVVEERSETFIDYTQKTWRHWLHESEELIWMSERDGWCHLWLYDTRSGQVKNQITHGAWPVREVLRVDAVKREVWFMASGLDAHEDPYHLHLCRASLDGTQFHKLTVADGHHQVEFSPDHAYFVDGWSRVDAPPVHELRRSSDGSLVCSLETADASSLYATQWQHPERFHAKGRDGETEIHGILIKPSHFDPSKKYPVIEEIYAGPHSAFVPKAFGRNVRESQMAELGFIVVRIDGMGTNHRGKGFHDVCWKNLKDAGFPDRIAWIRSAAQSRPWMDLERVGIYGGSAGGQSALRALLDHHAFYKVAVADCGCHDNRMDKIWWNEQWMGWPVDESYEASSNAADADRLQGELLLIVGELDKNVDPSSTLQVVHALQQSGKRFQFMPIIGAGHGAAETAYGKRLRMEFFVQHLQP